MSREKIGVSEFRTAAVPESTYCWPQLMMKIGNPALIAPRTARWPTWPRVGRRGRVIARNRASQPRPGSAAPRPGCGGSSLMVRLDPKERRAPDQAKNKMPPAEASGAARQRWGGWGAHDGTTLGTMVSAGA